MPLETITRRGLLGAGLCASVLAACASSRETPLEVSAAASLTDVLPRALAGWSARDGVRFRFDASSRLARQIEAGAPADLFVSADVAWMDELERRGLVEPRTRVPLLGNQLVVVVPVASAVVLRSPADLAASSVEHLALAGESVPAGRYADAALRWAHVDAALASRIVRGDSVRTALAWVASGDASAGVVYATDVASEPRVRVAFALPPESHPPIAYPAAVLHACRSLARARSALAWLRGPAAGDAFRRAGFSVLDAAR